MVFVCPNCGYKQEKPALRCPRCKETMHSDCAGCKLKKQGKCPGGVC